MDKEQAGRWIRPSQCIQLIVLQLMSCKTISWVSGKPLYPVKKQGFLTLGALRPGLTPPVYPACCIVVGTPGGKWCGWRMWYLQRNGSDESHSIDPLFRAILPSNSALMALSITGGAWYVSPAVTKNTIQAPKTCLQCWSSSESSHSGQHFQQPLASPFTLMAVGKSLVNMHFLEPVTTWFRSYILYILFLWRNTWLVEVLIKLSQKKRWCTMDHGPNLIAAARQKNWISWGWGLTAWQPWACSKRIA